MLEEDHATREFLRPSSSLTFEFRRTASSSVLISTSSLSPFLSPAHALPLKNDEPILSTTSQEPEVVEAQDSETVEPSPAQQKVEEVVETSPPLGLHLETQAPEVPGGPAFPCGSQSSKNIHDENVADIFSSFVTSQLDPPSDLPFVRQQTSLLSVLFKGLSFSPRTTSSLSRRSL